LHLPSEAGVKNHGHQTAEEPPSGEGGYGV
jgi:hypothetical protein